MHRRRTWLLLLAAAVALTLGILYECATHVGRGWLLGEAFFDGRPTSWWRGVVQRDIAHGPPDLGDAQAPPPNGRQTFWSRCKAFFGNREREFSSLNLLAEKDADGVLQELAGDGDAHLAGFARGAMTVRAQLTDQPPACGPGLVLWISWHDLLRKHRGRAADLDRGAP